MVHTGRADQTRLIQSRHFQDGDLKGAEALYGKAFVYTLLTTQPVLMPSSIQQDSQNPKLFTNRAMTRIRLQSWEACIDGCLRSIELDNSNMKGYYYLAQAQLALKHPNEAFNSAMTAYHECLKTSNSSTRNVSQLVLQAKKEKWEANERETIRRRSNLLRELEDALQRMKGTELWNVDVAYQGHEDSTDAREEREELEDTWRRKIEELRTVFALADPANLQPRVR